VRLLSASLRALNSVCRLVTASFLAAVLIPFAAAEALPASSPPTDSNAAIPAGWGVSGSAPQTGSSAHTSGRAFSAPNGQKGSAAPEAPTEPGAPNTPPAHSPNATEPAASKILVVIDKPTQEMKVFIDDVERYIWEVSTGLAGYDTPSGTYTARSMNEIWYSKEWDDAPMPHAIFFTKRGHAIHGTDETKKLGGPASHGCVRLSPENARALFALVKENSLENTEIVLNGNTPRIEARVAGSGPRKQQIRPPKKSTKSVLKKSKPSDRAKVASTGPRKQQVRPPKKSTKSVLKKSKPSDRAKVASSGLGKQQTKPPKEFVDPRFDPQGLEKPSRLRRKEWLRLYYSGGARISPPPRYYKAPLSPRAFRRH
jgi:lipoprotein-anchoring transpeptidase ErfK/SrfK